MITTLQWDGSARETGETFTNHLIFFQIIYSDPEYQSETA